MNEQWLKTPCPTCGGSLFVSDGGHVTCSYIPCKEPSVERAVAKLKSERDALIAGLETAGELTLKATARLSAVEAERDGMRRALERIYRATTDNPEGLTLVEVQRVAAEALASALEQKAKEE